MGGRRVCVRGVHEIRGKKGSFPQGDLKKKGSPCPRNENSRVTAMKKEKTNGRGTGSLKGITQKDDSCKGDSPTQEDWEGDRRGEKKHKREGLIMKRRKGQP